MVGKWTGKGQLVSSVPNVHQHLHTCQILQNAVVARNDDQGYDLEDKQHEQRVED